MKLEQSFEVDAPLERVWEALVDVERVAPCLPGAAVTGRNEDGSYSGTFTIKIGPTTASYAGKLEMQNIDAASHSATMNAQGSDKRGQGGATATIFSRLEAAEGSTRVEVVTDYHITGRLARFGRGGMIEDISERLLREFAGRLQSSLAGGAPSETPPAVGGEPPRDREEQPTVPFERVSEPEPPSTPAEPEVPPPPPPPAAEPTVVTEAAEQSPVTEAAEESPAAEEEVSSPPAAEEGPAAAAAEERPGSAPASGNTLDAGPLVSSVLIDRVKRNPKPLIAVAGGLLVLGLLRRRR